MAESRVHPAALVLPVFVAEGLAQPRAITSMPGVYQQTLDTLPAVIEQAVSAGLGAVMLFGVPQHKDAIGSGATDPQGILSRAVEVARTAAAGRLVVQADLCLDEFTDHGHCGVLSGVEVDNDATLVRYQQMAVVLARAGADMLGTSGMMDGQVGAVREALDSAGFVSTAILAYAAKYTSALYGPFREAVDSSLQGDRRTYQQDPANGREALRETALDLAQGADVVMVKPAYLDVVRAVAEISDVPVAVYQVSGEYAMLEAAAANGWIDRQAAILESLTGCVRAGADIIVTYWALEAAGWLA
ncbi:MAG: porphobilinogen synthase [Candidatus Nanopelagicales bacterium]|nr:porphobilinogen synthase [Candidatus Nanopelagicales bacterium]